MIAEASEFGLKHLSGDESQDQLKTSKRLRITSYEDEMQVEQMMVRTQKCSCKYPGPKLIPDLCLQASACQSDKLFWFFKNSSFTLFTCIA